ncbi:MAG: D-glycero-beta-D-manno-heptose-7-phosphate kinase [Spirochaetota bacterium]
MNLDFSGSRVLVIGDVILDKYYYGKVNRISPEAPVPIVKVSREIHLPGGCGNVVNNIKGLGAGAFHICLTGKDPNAEILKQVLTGANIKNKFITVNMPTVTKIRVIGEHQQVVRLDFEEKFELNKANKDKIFSAIDAAIEKSGAAVISDYGKGLCTPEICRYIIHKSSKKGIAVIVDPKGFDWDKYRNATVITPNVKELGEAVGREIPNEDNAIVKSGREIMKKYSLKNLLVTRSDKGMTLITEESVQHIPTEAREVFDVSGAGDTVVAALAVSLAHNLTMTESASLANRAAGIVVGKFGTAPVEIDELIHSFHNGSASKILSLHMLVRIIRELDTKNKKIVLSLIRHDTIDLKTVDSLQKEKEAGDILIALIINTSSEGKTRELTGIIAGLECVDYAAALNETELRDVMKQIKNH